MYLSNGKGLLTYVGWNPIIGKDTRKEMFEKEVEVILTDRGSEFALAEEAEIREDGTRMTRMFYCDSMASWQKGSLENLHLLVREICPKGCDLHALGLTSQEKANLISIHINSYPKEKLHGRSSYSCSISTTKKWLRNFMILELPKSHQTK